MSGKIKTDWDGNLLAIWPVATVVSPAQVELWYSDAVANNECQAGMETIHDKATALMDAGKITWMKQ